MQYFQVHTAVYTKLHQSLDEREGEQGCDALRKTRFSNLDDVLRITRQPQTEEREHLRIHQA